MGGSRVLASIWRRLAPVLVLVLGPALVPVEGSVAASGADTGVISDAGSSPLVRIDPTGAVFVAYERNVPEDGGDFGRDLLRLARSTDDGRTFGPAVDVFADADAMEAGTFHDALVAPGGTVYVAWLSYREYIPANDAGDDPKTQVRVARCDDGGATFGPSVQVDASSCECCRTSLALAADGTLLLAWRDREEQVDGGDPVRTMVGSRSADRGASWDAPTPFHHDGWRVGQCPESGPAIAIDGEGLLRATWFTGKESGAGVSYATSTDNGRSFAEPVALVTGDSFPRANVRAALAGDGFGVTWDDPRTEAGSIGLVRIDPDGTVSRGIGESLHGRTADVAVDPAGPILAWVSDEGVQVLPVADLGDAS